MTTITITANTSHDRLYDAITNGLENAGIDNYEINDSSSVPASVAPVARDAQEAGLDLAAIEARHARYRRRDEQETHTTSVGLVVAAIASAEDVPTLLAEVERLRAERDEARTALEQLRTDIGAVEAAGEVAGDE